MSNDIDRLDDDIRELEQRISDLEDDVYNKFLFFALVKNNDEVTEKNIKLFVIANDHSTAIFKFEKHCAMNNYSIIEYEIVDEI